MKEPKHFALILDDIYYFFRNKIETAFLLIVRFRYITGYIKHTDELSSYPKPLRKSTVRIFFENLVWMAKHGEVNRNYFQYLFDRKTDPVDQEEYMPFHLYNRLRKKANRGVKLVDGYLNYTCILRDKFIFYEFMKGMSLPTPDVVAVCDNGQIRWLESGSIAESGSILQYGDADLFCKSVNGDNGYGVFLISVDDGRLFINGERSSVEDFEKRVRTRSILQKRLKQHEEMDRLFSGTVNTIRIGTFNDGKRVRVFNAILKLGASGEVVDNWHRGGLLVGIDLQTGRLMKYGVPYNKCGNTVLRHPDSEVVFNGFEIPYFEDSLELVRTIHSTLYGIVTIGWDIAITENGPVVIEGNDNWDFRMFQVYYGGCRKSLLALFNGQP